MSTVAFLQNQWFKNPERARAVFARRPQDREKLLRAYLFMGCVTGKRLKAALGDELCRRIVWEEISPEIGGHSSSVFPADLSHIASVLAKHQPARVIAFGKVAEEPLKEIKRSGVSWELLTAPHPAARTADIPKRLAALGEYLRSQP